MTQPLPGDQATASRIRAQLFAHPGTPGVLTDPDIGLVATVRVTIWTGPPEEDIPFYHLSPRAKSLLASHGMIPWAR